MSDEQGQRATASATVQQGGLDDSEPTAERQAELRAAYEANVAVERPPYAAVHVRTRGEFQWILAERGWATDPESEQARLALSGVGTQEGPDLRGISLSRANLQGVFMYRANLSDAQLDGVNLAYAFLGRGNLANAHLWQADLRYANLDAVDLTSTHLWQANLAGAYLGEASLAGAHLQRTDLRGASLRRVRMDGSTVLRDTVLDDATRLVDVAWNGAPLTQVDWGQAPRLGDEQAIRDVKNRKTRITAYRDAARAYRGLSVALRSQGLINYASNYRLREQRMERAAQLREGKLGGWLFSLLLDLVAGYGERPGRIFISYVTVVLAFAAAYFGVTHLLETQLSSLTWDESLVLSLTSFHGRGFFPGFLSLGDWVARLAAAEAVIGLFIELILIATFSRRFLGN